MVSIILGDTLYTYKHEFSSIRFISFWCIVAYFGLSSILWLVTACLERHAFFVGQELNRHHRLAINSEFHAHRSRFVLTFTFTYTRGHGRTLLRKRFSLRKSIENYIDVKGYFHPALLHHDVDTLLATVLLK